MFRRAFTLVEMLVVMGILVVLLSILLPAAGKAKDMANGLKCQANLKAIDNAMLAFAADNGGLPGEMCAYMYDSNPLHLDWLFGLYAMVPGDPNWWPWPGYGTYNNLQRLATAPECGTLWPYLNDYSVYLCPSLTVTQPGSGSGSNGRFDYGMFSIFRGAQVRQIKVTSWYYYNVVPKSVDPGSVWTSVKSYGSSTYPDDVFLTQFNFSNRPADIFPTPLVCQEDAMYGSLPGYGINNCANPQNHISGLYGLSGSHFGFAQMAHVHNGGAYYGAIDGSVNFFLDPGITDTSEYWIQWNSGTTGTNNWITRAPSGSLRQLGSWAESPDYWLNSDCWNTWSRL